MSAPILKSIYDLLDKNYFIPSYQRGYRWGERQVQDLLDDLLAFADSKKSANSFYCLQPVVVKQCDAETIKANCLNSTLDDNVWYEVIDGQQRLTTIYLLLKYLSKELACDDMRSKYGKDLFRISYQTRDNDENYIENPSTYCNNSPNAHYITQAYKHVADWFASLPTTKNKPQIRTEKENILTLLTNTKNNQSGGVGYVQVIWYEPDDTDPIKTFTRLNIGKIPLKNAELIKALFLQKRNDGKTTGNRDDDKISQIQQIQIAKEWDQIEAAFQDERVWAFLNENLSDSPAHIEIIFDVISDRAKTEMGAEQFTKLYGDDQFASFRYFHERFEKATRNDVEREWSRVRDYYETFMGWYNNPLWYHYIGFLIYCGTSLLDIYDLYEGQTKEDFAQKLVDAIRDKLEVYLTANDEARAITNKKGEALSYNKEKMKLKQLLVLYNIEYILKHNEKVTRSYMLFPFDLFKAEDWEIEHIDSFTTNPLTKYSQQVEWLDTMLNALKYYKIDYEKNLSSSEIGILDEFRNNRKSDLFGTIQDIVSRLAGEYLTTEEVKKEIKNTIGNLTLLNGDINSGYGNAIFPSKKKFIAEKDSMGRFIPICTKNVFFKNLVGVSSNPLVWDETDMEAHQKSIIDVVEKFLIQRSEDNGKKI